MRSAVKVPVTVKCRIGVDDQDPGESLFTFVDKVAEAGCEVFIVHARNAWLQGLSPKENREVPPLRHGLVYRLKADFPHLTIVLNGGVDDDESVAEHLGHVDGVMVGRHAYHEPYAMAGWDERFFDDTAAQPDRDTIERSFVDYMSRIARQGVPWPHAARHMLGLRHGQPGARRWRQVWSDHRLKGEAPARVHALALAALKASPAPVMP
jgi:tRNA-dihydrouridine synthase A